MHEPPEDEQFEDSEEPFNLEKYLSSFSNFTPPDDFDTDNDARMQKVKDALDPLEQLTEIESEEAKRKMRDAAKILEENIDLDPELRLVLGNIQFHLKDIDSAQGHFQEHLREHPQAADAWYNLGRVLLMKGQPQEALDALDKSYGLSPDFDTLLQLGNAYRETGRLEDAIDSFNRYLEYEPEDAYAHISLGQAYLLAGEGGLAAQAFANAYARAKGNPQQLFDVGVWYRHLDDFATAHNIFTEALELFPCPIDARLLLAETQLNLEKYDEAEQNALIYCRARQKDPHGWYILGVTELLKRSYGLAEAAFKEFNHLDESNNEARFYLALCRIAQNKYEEAGRTLQETGSREGNNWLIRAGSSLSSRDLKNAEYCLEKCVREDLTNTNHWNYLLNIKLARGKRIEPLLEKMVNKYSIAPSSVLIVL